MPFGMVYITFKLLWLALQPWNAMKNREIVDQLTSQKVIDILPEIAFKDVKDKCTAVSTPKQKVTVNDLLLTVLSKTLREYLVELGDTKTDTVYLIAPFSLRPQPQHIGDFTFDNNFGMVWLPLRLIDNQEEGLI